MSQQIGRYEIIGELGQGGMATVYLAFDSVFERQVAIKVLPRQFTEDPRSLQRFEQEAKTVAGLEDAAIVPVYEFGEADGWPYLVMRYMPGGTLGDRLTGRPLALEEISGILNRLAPALDLAHEKGFVHLDLKPDNVLFDGQGRPYLADFGIARMAEATQTVTLRGTPAYMSPEQAEGELEPDGRSDIYSLGVVLFEMLTGRKPYMANTPTKQIIMHITQPIPDVLEANANLPAQAQTIIDRVMAKDREERYQTAVELAEAVGQLLAEAATAVWLPVVPPEQLAIVEPDMPMVEADQAETVLDTPPEAVAAAARVGSAVEGKAPEPDPLAVEREGLEDRLALPAWAWWAGAIGVILILAFGLRDIIGNGGDGMAEATAEGRGDIVAVIPTETATATPSETPEPPMSMETATPRPTWTPRPTATLDPRVPSPDAELGDVWERPKDQMRMVYVPDGTFFMGSEEWGSDEQPVHEVTLDGFWIDETEVTNAQYRRCVDTGECEVPATENESAYNGEDYPVVGISWHDADAYCRWVGGELPTEAHWEYAARGPEGNKYPWGEEFDGRKANYCDKNCESSLKDEAFDDGYARTAPVGSYSEGASWAGAMDMAGNVWEWVNDWYDSDYYADSTTDNPVGPESGSSKVLRGGAWDADLIALRGATRSNDGPVGRDDALGFRCVLPGESVLEESIIPETLTLDPSATVDPSISPPDPELGSVWERPKDQMTMVYVPPGTFPMGSVGGTSDEQPVHDVTLDGFWIDQTEVSNKQFGQFVTEIDYETTAEKEGSGRNYTGDGLETIEGADWQHPQGPGSSLSGLEDHPVVLISWEDAHAYCDWAGGVLPSEAQWEYAARGPQSLIYPWGNTFNGRKVNFCDQNCPFDWKDESVDDGYARTAPVGSYEDGVSWVGALDMVGNVDEWVADWYDKNYYATSLENNPPGPANGAWRVLRGGTWAGASFILRGADRLPGPPDLWTDLIGIRCALPGN